MTIVGVHALFGLQIVQVAILLLHDWIPLGPFNDVRAARRSHTVAAVALGTAISALLPSIGLALSVAYLRSAATLATLVIVASHFVFERLAAT
jgi:hypothetical protein